MVLQTSGLSSFRQTNAFQTDDRLLIAAIRKLDLHEDVVAVTVVTLDDAGHFSGVVRQKDLLVLHKLRIPNR